MAVTNMWAIKGKVSTLVNYIENPEKTSARTVNRQLLPSSLPRLSSSGVKKVAGWHITDTSLSERER